MRLPAHPTGAVTFEDIVFAYPTRGEDRALHNVSFSVRRDLEVPEDSDVKITSEGLLGGSFLEITPGASEFMLENDDQVLNTQSSIDFLNLLMRFGTGE